MMKLFSRWLRPAYDHRSYEWRQSDTYPGVWFALRRVSVQGRLELAEQVRSLLKDSGPHDGVAELITDLQLRQLYLRWSLLAIKGLFLDGRLATPDLLISWGPESLCAEVIEIVKSQLGFTEEERKN